jgi:hypothetical protein
LLKHDFSTDDYAAMKVVERAIIEAALPLIQKIDPLLAFYACIRCARVFLRKHDREVQKTLVPVAAAYLAGNTTAPNPSLLWTPPGMQH